jgi:large subunit ribosomal protein L23
MIIKPIITEKTLKLVEEKNQYTFMVQKTDNKVEIAKAVAKKFNVKVLEIRMIRVVGKKVAFGRKRISGRKQEYKKAIVKLPKTAKIGLFKLK